MVSRAQPSRFHLKDTLLRECILSPDPGRWPTFGGKRERLPYAGLNRIVVAVTRRDGSPSENCEGRDPWRKFSTFGAGPTWARPQLRAQMGIDICPLCYILQVAWDVEFTDEFGAWWDELSEEEQESVRAIVELLQARGPFLGYPYSSDIRGSRHGGMRELRIQHAGEPYRILYAFDPRRIGILLAGGCKTGDDRWYQVTVPVADDLFDQHLEEISTGGAVS